MSYFSTVAYIFSSESNSEGGGIILLEPGSFIFLLIKVFLFLLLFFEMVE